MSAALAPAVLVGYLLAVVRAVAWVYTSPPFHGHIIPSKVKIGLAAGLSLALGPHLADLAVPMEPVPLMGAAALQALAGVALGFITQMIFSAIQAAGTFIDVFGGFSMVQLFDPNSSAVTSIWGRFYNLIATTLLFASGGHLLLVRGFLTSFQAAPMTSIDLDKLSHMVTHDFGLFFLAAAEIAAPLVAVLFLTDIALGLLSKAAPQMNVLQLGMPLKILICLVLGGVVITLLPSAVTHLLDTGITHGVQLLKG
jgi:flagellar biosynthetic protein FliR